MCSQDLRRTRLPAERTYRKAQTPMLLHPLFVYTPQIASFTPNFLKKLGSKPKACAVYCAL